MADPSKDPERNTRRRPPATTPEARENQMIAIAFDLAEQQLRDGTASAPTINHFLKLGSSRERIEQKKIEADTQVAVAKIELMASQERTDAMYKEALAAISQYQGRDDEQFID